MASEEAKGDLPTLDALRIENRAALVNLLRADLDLAFTFLQTARLDTRDGRSHARALNAKARRALGRVRHLNELIQDPRDWQEIHARADELETAVNRI